MADTIGRLPFETRAPVREMGPYWVRFTTGASNTNVVDPAKIVSSVTENDAGDYTILFKDGWKRINAVANIRGGVADTEQPHAYVKDTDEADSSSLTSDIDINIVDLAATVTTLYNPTTPRVVEVMVYLGRAIPA